MQHLRKRTTNLVGLHLTLSTATNTTLITFALLPPCRGIKKATHPLEKWGSRLRVAERKSARSDAKADRLPGLRRNAVACDWRPDPGTAIRDSVVEERQVV